MIMRSLLCFFILLWPVLVDKNKPGKVRVSVKEETNSIGMKLVRLEAGEFVMGQSDAPPRTREEWQARDWDESPAHKVHISKSFAMGIHEVTNAQYEQFDPEHKKQRGKNGATKEDDEPVTNLTWQQAMDFCAWLSKKEGKTYRLPTEAEWEYACRAGTTTAFSTGDMLSFEQANFGLKTDGKGVQGPIKVGSYKANPWGLFDMHGNVAEWCLDWYGPYPADAQTDPVGRVDGSSRIVRGWNTLIPKNGNGQRYCRSANRSGHLPDDANRYTGFRVVQAELPSTKPLPMVLAPHQKEVRQQAAPKKGPDPAKPFFVSYKGEKKNPTLPANSWGPIFSAHNHYSAVCVCPNGDVLAAWYTTVSEAGRECSQAASRLRVGSDTWEPASSFLTVPDVNCHAPILFSDGKRIYHIFNQGFFGWDYAALAMRTSDDSGATWTRPRIILSRDEPLRLSQPCNGFVAKDGTLVVSVDGDGHRDERLITSKDGGKTWQVGQGCMRKACDGKYVIHPATVQRDDGSLVTYLRGPDPMPQVVSRDLGESWKMETTPFPGISVGQKSAAIKLSSGALLLCSLDSKKRVVNGGTFAALSLDDGKTWPHVRKVEGVGGYMSVAQGPDGTIYLFGSRLEGVAFNEAWLKEGKPLP